MPKISNFGEVIDFKEYTLNNGLTVLANRDRKSKMAAVNILYRVGSVDESPDRTGFAHLFEHLMFRGTQRIPVFDTHVQNVCGESNAFTTNDYTDYYIALPKEAIETALWLEADRMCGLKIEPEKTETEKSVVIEEFNQRFLNRPYGDQWHLMRSMVFKHHPYRWPTIGLTPDHIRSASIEEIEAFYRRYYVPSNAILSVSADIDSDELRALVEKWFGELPSLPTPERSYAVEPPQTAPRRIELSRSNIAADQITIAFPMEARTVVGDPQKIDRNFYICDFLSDILSGGESARMYRSLVKEQRLFSSVNAYITGEVQSGMFVLTGQLMEGVEVERGEQALWGQLRSLINNPPSDYECQKVKNKFEANTLFGELNVMNKAMNLGFYHFVGNMQLLNGETHIYRSLTADEAAEYVECHLTVEQSSTLIYHRES